MAKGQSTTTFIWSLHADAHDYDIQSTSFTSLIRKIWSSNAAHVALVCLWLSGMHFHGAYFGNYSSWFLDPTHVAPTCHVVWDFLHQDAINFDAGNYHSGILITSGLYQLWFTSGISSTLELKNISLILLCCSLLLIFAAYLHLKYLHFPSSALFCKTKAVSVYHLALLLGFSSIVWSGHLLHISAPLRYLTSSGLTADVLLSPASLLSLSEFTSVFPFFSYTNFLSFAWLKNENLFTSDVFDSATGSLNISLVILHHFYLGVMLLLVAQITFLYKSTAVFYLSSIPLLSHISLSVALVITGALSIVHSQHLYLMNSYAFLASDYLSTLCIYTDHMWIGGFLMVGGFSHASISLIRESRISVATYFVLSNLSFVLAQRDIIIGHLQWVCILLGLHSFGLYIHNDTMISLGRCEDMFSDTALSLRPFFTNILLKYRFNSFTVNTNIYAGRIGSTEIELGTADFMVHHIHAFTLHVTILILLKGLLYARSSRLVSDKIFLGFRFPCDGPGRGGTCQISGFDHTYLGLFWMYNCISVVIFHFSFKAQSDIWGSVTETSVTHITGGDFGASALAVNAWLTNFLWSQASQVIQSYGTSTAGYGLVFLSGHFLWAFSLMFLFSGRGYWQELIESILWSHAKIKLTIANSPRALSISQGRAVGLTHYLFGGILVTWSYFHARLTVLTT